MDSFHGTVGLRSTGANETLLGACTGKRASEGFGAELATVVSADCL